MQLCTKCIVPDSFPGVTFEDGVCSFCRAHERLNKTGGEVLGKQRLGEEIAASRGGEFDCGVPISGGKDSSYVLYYLVRKLGLRPLALFFDNGFINELARDNVRGICDSLGVELVIGTATHHRHALVREALLTSRNLGRFVRICGNCENNLRSFAINEAERRGIGLLVWGSTDFEEGADYYIDPDLDSFRQYHGRSGYLIRRARKALSTFAGGRRSAADQIRTVWHGLKCLYHGVRDNIAQRAPEGWRRLNPFLEVSFDGKPVGSISFFDYIPYDPEAMIRTLKTEIGWKAPADREARMDCMIHSLANYQHLAATGITRDGFTLTVLVRNGLLTRGEALRKEEAMKRELIAECREFIDQTGIDVGGLLHEIPQ
jgi:hypothetical protein